ncbi:tyrosine-type recombinase/integrase [Verrucomicrobiota bacterium]
MAKHTTSNGRRKRSKRGMGRLFKKQGARQFPADSPAAGSYYLTYYVDGERKTRALRDKDGHAITDRKAAEAERRRILAPFTTGDDVEKLKAVQAALGNAEAEHLQAVEEANPPLRIKDAWQAYLRAKVKRPDSGPATLRQYEGHWTRFENWITEAHPEAVHLRDVTPEMAEEYAENLLGAVSGGRFNKHVRFLDLCFRVLAKPGRITLNPWRNPKRNDGEGIPRRDQQTHNRRELTLAELTRVLDRADQVDADLAFLLYLGAATGLRLGDCATLQWGEVDLARKIIRRIPNKTAKKGEPVKVGIPPALHKRLSAVKGRTGYVLPRMQETYCTDATRITNVVRAHFLDCGIDVHAQGTGKRIKRKADGSPVRDKGSGRAVVEDTGKPAVVDVGFHSLRHTWVSMHAERGTSQAVIQDSVGHANPSMTKHYTHISEQTARETALALPVFAGKGNSLPQREPLPAWAQEMVQSIKAAADRLNARNWKRVKADVAKELEAAGV